MKIIKTTLVIGGCRSGKSNHALKLAASMGTKKKIFLATCIPQDEEMHQRVSKHQTERGKDWTAIETPVYLAEAITKNSPKADIILVDCLTLWVSNLMMTYPDVDVIFSQTTHLIKSLGEASCPVVLVTNEVGNGIVPENKIARQFRDAVGYVNQQVAAGVDQVIWMVAGIPVRIKPVNEFT
jgi:adenosylcobinamide kinase / adenosylcobinamide-phosphate guanylyltransferase